MWDWLRERLQGIAGFLEQSSFDVLQALSWTDPGWPGWVIAVAGFVILGAVAVPLWLTVRGRRRLSAKEPDLADLTRWPRMLGYGAVLLLLAGFGGWSSIAPLASAAIATGVVSPDGYRKTVQHLEGGIIQEIHVREGDSVVAGQPLVLTYAVRQHGHNLVGNLQGRLEGRSGQRVVTAAATPTSDVGYYTSTLNLPAAGTWTITIDSGFFGNYASSTFTLEAVAAGAPAPLVTEDARPVPNARVEAYAIVPSLEPAGERAVLIAAELVVRTLQQLQTMNPGFDPQNALTMSFDLGLQGYDEARGQQFYRQLNERLQTLPGVESVALMNYIPLSLNYNSGPVFAEGKPAERGENVPLAMVASVGPGYFKTMKTPILQLQLRKHPWIERAPGRPGATGRRRGRYHPRGPTPGTEPPTAGPRLPVGRRGTVGWRRTGGPGADGDARARGPGRAVRRRPGPRRGVGAQPGAGPRPPASRERRGGRTDRPVGRRSAPRRHPARRDDDHDRDAAEPSDRGLFGSEAMSLRSLQ